MAISIANTATDHGYGQFDTDSVPEALDQLADNQTGGQLTWDEWVATGLAPVDELQLRLADGSTVLL